MRRDTDTRARWTIVGEALPDGFGPPLCRGEKTQGHIPAKRHVPTPPSSGVKEPVAGLIDHTL
jgi:hypothetical protein